MPANMKGIIADTLLQMVQHTSVDNITVTALIDRCHISRQTFYYHFENLMDVLEWGVRQTTRQLMEQSLSAKDIHAALQIFISFSVERFPLLQKMLDSQRRAQVERIMIEAVSAYLNELARNRHLATCPSATPTGRYCFNTLPTDWWGCCCPTAESRIWTGTGWPISWSGFCPGSCPAGSHRRHKKPGRCAIWRTALSHFIYYVSPR